MIFGDTDFNDCTEPYDESKCYCLLKDVVRGIATTSIPEQCPLCNKTLSGKHRKNVINKVKEREKRREKTK
jgi:hypothetical protein